MNLTRAANSVYDFRTAPHWAVEVDSSVIQARKICADRHMSFFMRSALWWGGVFGGFGLPVPEPGLSTITPRHRPKFDSFGRWFKTTVQESIMTNNTQVAPVALTISDIPVRQDSEGRYCLNDLHKASGNNPKHKPAIWLQNQQTQDLISELEKDGVGNPTSKIQGRGKEQGTYACKELVYAYGMWISASFSLKVIRAYDALQNQPTNNTCQLPNGSLDDQEYLKASRTLLIDYVDACIAAVESVGAKAPIWPELNQQVIDGLIAERLMSSRMLLSFDNDFKMRLSQVPRDSCVISPKDPVSLRAFIKECVSPELLHVVMESASQRMDRYIQYLKTKLPAKV